MGVRPDPILLVPPDFRRLEFGTVAREKGGDVSDDRMVSANVDIVKSGSLCEIH